MNADRKRGVWLGLLLALLTLSLAAGGAGAASSQPPPLTSSDARPTAAPRVSPAPPRATTAPSPTLPPTLTSTPSLTYTPAPTSKPEPSPTATAEVMHQTVIGRSVEGRDIAAFRFGAGPLKAVLVGDIHGEFEANTYALAQQLVAHFEAHPGEVPPDISLWIIPTINPDGLATGHRWNAHDVDLNRNADTDLDGCAGNDWSPDTIGLEGPHPGAGGPYPFSEPESQAVRDFLDDAWIAVFYHSAAEAIFVDTCQQHVPTARLAQVLSESTGYPVPEEGWAGYPITGDFGDYLAGEGVAAVTLELADKENPEFDRNLAGVRALLAHADEIVSAEAAEVEAQMIWLDEENTGVWRYPENSFIHPLALEVMVAEPGGPGAGTAYLLDGGRVLALDLAKPAPLRVLLAPGDDVAGVRVLEPLDLALVGESLLVLDRAGDVYRYDPAADVWAMERYDRPSGATYDLYFVALSVDGGKGYLLETTHEQVWRFAAGQKGAAWVKVPLGRDVDVSVSEGNVLVLTRNLNSPQGHLLRYRDGQQVSGFAPNVGLMQPRQVLAAGPMVYVLDRAGRRLLALDSASGRLQALYQFTDRRQVSAIWAAPGGESLILAGRDRLYFFGQPERQATITAGPTLEPPQPHDLALLATLRGLRVPIEGATLTSRDFQMPGAPRHYRLGVHEGMDFYGHTVGVPVNRDTPVRAVADGVVIRALVDYQPLTAAQADAWYAASHRLGYTPAEVLDGYRGRQVWIDHGGGLVSRYAHLGSIAPGIVAGATVSQGQPIATWAIRARPVR